MSISYRKIANLVSDEPWMLWFYCFLFCMYEGLTLRCLTPLHLPLVFWPCVYEGLDIAVFNTIISPVFFKKEITATYTNLCVAYHSTDDV
jgi:hypothetical protein